MKGAPILGLERDATEETGILCEPYFEHHAVYALGVWERTKKGSFWGNYIWAPTCFCRPDFFGRRPPFFWGAAIEAKQSALLHFQPVLVSPTQRLVHPWDRQKKDRHKSPFSLPRFSVSLSLISMPFDYSPASLSVCVFRP